MKWRSGGKKREELNAEINAHMEMDAQARIARGESPADATRNAARDFGDVTTVREVTSDMWSGEWLHHLWQDVRHAARRLARVPGFTAVAVITLALGIGANTAIFSVLNGVILRPLPYPKPEQLVFINSQFPTMGFTQFWMDGGELIEFRERNKSFSDVGGYVIGAVNVGADEAPTRAVSGIVSAGFFQALGITPEKGRFFSDAELAVNGPRTVILSDELWHSAFGGRPVVDSQVTINGIRQTVVGIMPPGFDIHDQGVRIWQPNQLDPAQVASYRGGHYLYLIGRLKNGVSLTQARAELETMLANWVALDGGTPGQICCPKGFVHAPDPKFHRVQYAPLQGEMVGSISRAIWVLQAAVALVLLIACANLANLLLMRAESQQKDLAVRAALGAGRGRLITYFAGESAVLTVAGTLLGAGLAYVGVRTLVAVGGTTIPRSGAIRIDASVLAFTAGVAIATGIVFGLVPLLHISSEAVLRSLRDSGTRTTAGSARHRVRRGLVVAEMAFAVMLVTGAGLLLRSFWNLTNVDGGFDRRNLSTFAIALPPRVYTDSVKRVNFFNDLTHKLAALPAVQGATAMQGLPPRRQVNASDTQFEGIVQGPNAPPQNVDYYQYASPNYFEVMKIAMVAGRAFGPQDGPNSAPVVVINETLAKTWYPGIDPVGHRLKPGGDTAFYTIIGVAKDVKQGGVDSKTGTELYIDVEQTPRSGFAPSAMNIVLRSTSAQPALVQPVREIVRSLDPSLPVVNFRTMDQVFSESISRQHFLAELLGAFAIIAVLLAAVGTYGVMAYTVAERTREIGIRMALGASGQGVLAMVLRQGLVVAVTGVALGIPGAWVLTRLASSLLFGIAPFDPVTFSAVAVLMLAVAVTAAGVPARRAMGIDPIRALKAD